MILRPATAAQKSKGPKRYIADTGSAFDIVPIMECDDEVLTQKFVLRKALEMSTVNGPVKVNEGIRLAVPTLNRDIEFVLMPDSPPIVSVGKLCIQKGYQFHWFKNEAPYLIDPNGHRINMVVDNFVPYISSDNGKTPEGHNVASTSDTTGAVRLPATANEERWDSDIPDPDAKASE